MKKNGAQIGRVGHARDNTSWYFNTLILRYRRDVRWVPPAVACVVVLAADVLTKALSTSGLQDGRTVDLPLGMRLEHGENSGVAFGLLAGSGVVLLVVAVAALGLILCLARSRPATAMPGALVFGGALANLIDRAGDGAVTDFIDLGPWPSFNLADVAITVGVTLLALALMREPGPQTTDPKQTTTDVGRGIDQLDGR